MKAIKGNTYPVRAELRALGGRWNAEARCWEVPDDREQEARGLVASAPSVERMVGGRAFATRVCWECGCRFTRDDCDRNGGDWQESYCGC